MKTKIVYKNINIFTVCRPFTSYRGTAKSTYRLLSKQWQRRIKIHLVIQYCPISLVMSIFVGFFFSYTHLVQTQ